MTEMRPRIAVALSFAAAAALAAAVSAFVTTATAADAANPDAQIKFRKGVMQAVGGSASNIAAVLKGDVAAEGQIGTLLQILVTATEPALLEAAFKPDTTGKGSEKTTASPKIWTDWDGYSAKAVEFRTAVVAAAEKGEDVSFDDMKKVFGTCKACHDDYRER